MKKASLYLTSATSGSNTAHCRREQPALSVNDTRNYCFFGKVTNPL